jgi:hypothetical protein
VNSLMTNARSPYANCHVITFKSGSTCQCLRSCRVKYVMHAGSTIGPRTEQTNS